MRRARARLRAVLEHGARVLEALVLAPDGALGRVLVVAEVVLADLTALGARLEREACQRSGRTADG